MGQNLFWKLISSICIFLGATFTFQAQATYEGDIFLVKEDCIAIIKDENTLCKSDDCKYILDRSGKVKVGSEDAVAFKKKDKNACASLSCRFALSKPTNGKSYEAIYMTMSNDLQEGITRNALALAMREISYCVDAKETRSAMINSEITDLDTAFTQMSTPAKPVAKFTPKLQEEKDCCCAIS